jgi:outer membrane protein, heavy metal efflux system
MLYLRNAPVFGAGAGCFAFLRFSLSLILLTTLVTSARAESRSLDLSLSSALQNTLEQNPSLKVYAFRKDALNGSAFTANLRPGYEVEVEAENFAGSGESDGFDSAELTVSLSSVLEMGGKRNARGGIVRESRAILDTQMRLESLELLGEATRRFIDALASQARVELSHEALTLAQETVSVSQKRANAGATSAAEANRAQSALEMARLTAASEKQRLEFHKVSLSALWGEATPTFGRLNGDLFQFGRDAPFEELYSSVSNSPAVQLFTNQDRMKEAELRVAKAQSKSDLSWSIGIRSMQETDDTAIVAGLSMPLFPGRRNKGEVSRLIAERSSIAMERDTSVLELRTLLFNAYSSRQQAIYTVNQLQTKVIPFLEDALEQTRQGYERGRFGYLDYITVAQELLESKRLLIDSAAAVLTYGAEIEQLTADTISVDHFIPNTASSGVAK